MKFVSRRLMGISLFLTIALIPSGFSGYYEDAYKAYNENRMDEAISILEEGLSAAPNDEQLAVLLGQSYFKAKKYDKAIEAFKKAIALAPENPQAHFWMGIAYTIPFGEQKKPAWFEASQAFAEALKYEPNDTNYLYNYGHSLLELDKPQQAYDNLKKAFDTEKGSQDFKISMDLGIASQKIGNKEEAATYLEKATKINPEKYQPLFYLGNLYYEGGEYDKVAEIGQRMVTLDPKQSRGYIYQGMGKLQSKEYAAAKQAFEQAIQIDAKDALAYYNLGLAVEGVLGNGAGSYQSLIDAYSKAIAMTPANVPGEWHYRLGHAYELEASLDWDRAERNEEARSRAKSNLEKAQAAYKKAGENENAKRGLVGVQERLRRLTVIG